GSVAKYPGGGGWRRTSSTRWARAPRSPCGTAGAANRRLRLPGGAFGGPSWGLDGCWVVGGAPFDLLIIADPVTQLKHLRGGPIAVPRSRSDPVPGILRRHGSHPLSRRIDLHPGRRGHHLVPGSPDRAAGPALFLLGMARGRARAPGDRDRRDHHDRVCGVRRVRRAARPARPRARARRGGPPARDPLPRAGREARDPAPPPPLPPRP